MVAAVNKMHMGVIKPGQQKLSLGVQDLGLRTMPCIHVSAAAYSHNAVAQYSQSLRLRTALIDSPDFRVGDNKVRRRFDLSPRYLWTNDEDGHG